MIEKSLTRPIPDCIERSFDFEGRDLSRKIIIYPCGDVGIQVINIMKTIYNLTPAFMIDNHKWRYNESIKRSDFLNDLEPSEYIVIISTTDKHVYSEIKSSLDNNNFAHRAIELESMTLHLGPDSSREKTKDGKYSYGLLCENGHPLVESIGAFCSFAAGVDYLGNHELRYISTHPFLYLGQTMEGGESPYECYRDYDFFFPGVMPRSELIRKYKRAKIGNDVWLGRNVVVTNNANIGNGVVAAAGAVITKDVPDYAVVMGVPARIVRFRYSSEQIKALNRIAWWDWSDEEIRSRYDDFYLPVDEFIKKYG